MGDGGVPANKANGDGATDNGGVPANKANGSGATDNGGAGGVPANKANGGGATDNGGAGGIPANKARQYGSARPVYRPLASRPPRRRCLKCCCVCFLWLTVFLISLVLLAAIAAVAFYVLYNPQLPRFYVVSLRLSALNVTSSDLLASQLDLSVATRNPNEKFAFLYDDFSLFAYCDGVEIGEASLPAFVQGTTNTTVIQATLSSSGWSLDPEEAANLRKRQKFPLEIEVKTKVGVQIGGFRSKRIGIKALCGDFEVGVTKEKAATAATSLPDAPCRVQLWIKIWHWTL